MKLWFIYMQYKSKVWNQKLNYRMRFDYRTFFISYYISKQIRKLKIDTDGTYNAINILVKEDIVLSQIEISHESIFVSVPFDPRRYDNVSDTERCKYYLELMREGFGLARQVKDIPYDTLMGLTYELEKMDYVYRWVFKRLFIRPLDLRIDFLAKLDTYDYILTAVATDLKTKAVICESRVVRTLPDNMYFEYLRKKFKISGDHLYILNTNGDEAISINLKKVMKGTFKAKLCGPPARTFLRPSAAATFRSLQQCLVYDNDDYNLGAE